MATTKKSDLEKTKTPGVYRRGKKYVYVYRIRGVQRWKTVETYDEARRGKLAAEVDVERGELRDLSRVYHPVSSRSPRSQGTARSGLDHPHTPFRRSQWWVRVVEHAKGPETHWLRGERQPTRSTAERVAERVSPPIPPLPVMPRPAGSGAQPVLAASSAEAVMVGQGKSVRTARSAPEG